MSQTHAMVCHIHHSLIIVYACVCDISLAELFRCCMCVTMSQVTVELASDSNDFAAALAKMQLAEMGSVKMVPIAQQPKPKSQPVVTAKPLNSASISAG